MRKRGLPSSSWSVVIRAEYDNKVGRLGQLTSAIGRAGGDIGAVDLVESVRGRIRRDITINARDQDHEREIVESVRAIPWVQVVTVLDRTFQAHRGGKIEVVSRTPIRTRDDLARVYTPGVARVSEAIAEDPRRAFSLTIKRHCVAVVTDGSAVLGLGDIGPLAALPVMEGKAALFKEFGGVDAFPICLDARDPDEIVRIVEAIAPTFGAINLEDISAPRCFEIESRLRASLPLPVFHDDQHGTAVVVLAALLNALKLVGKQLRQVRIVVSGAGAAATGCVHLLRRAGARQIIVGDRAGIIYAGRKQHMTPQKEWLAVHTNPDRLTGRLGRALAGADVFIGLSTPGAVKAAAIRTMGRDAVVFALANPIPEVMPEEIEGAARVIATGRSDYPNQINNVLCFPGLMRGLLDARVEDITDKMLIAAARAIARAVPPSELHEDYIIPSVFDARVAPAVAEAVVAAAR
jgi:malate dehydrogenase (oxaloacetate-decarboxylating)